MVSGGDGYFFYYRKIDDILTYSETETTEISQAIEKRVLGMTEGLAEIGRNIYEDLGEQYLLFVADSNAAVLGGWINLNKLIEDLNMIFVLMKSSKEEEKCAIQDVVIYLSDYFRLPTNGFGRWKWPACMK